MEIPSLTRAEYLIKRSPQGCSSTIPLIEKAMQRAQGYHNTRQVIRFQVVKAVALKCAGRLNEALDVLEETLRLAEPLGFMRTFLDRGPIMAELLDALLQRCPGNAYGRRLLGAFEGKTTSEPQETAADLAPWN
ncbi:MAG: hypothetical protein JRF56_04525 [Deltaproteobacteria bacterium]|nr:hypothetical protein [Deltaproteobacteria bacterium]